MRRIWRFLPSRRTKRSWSSLTQSTCAGQQRLAVELEAVAQQRQSLGAAAAAPLRVATRTRYSFSIVAVVADQLARDAAVLRQHEQADRIDVEPAGRERGSRRCCGEKRMPERSSRHWRSRRDQDARRLVAVLGLAADVADRLVEQDGDELRLRVARARVDRDVLARQDARAELGDDAAVDADPAARDPFVGFAARGEAELAHALRQAQAAVVVRPNAALTPLPQAGGMGDGAATAQRLRARRGGPARATGGFIGRARTAGRARRA